MAAAIFLGSLTAQLTLVFAGSLVRPLIRTPGRILAVNVASLVLIVGLAVGSIL